MDFIGELVENLDVFSHEVGRRLCNALGLEALLVFEADSSRGVVLPSRHDLVRSHFCFPKFMSLGVPLTATEANQIREVSSNKTRFIRWFSQALGQVISHMRHVFTLLNHMVWSTRDAYVLASGATQSSRKAAGVVR